MKKRMLSKLGLEVSALGLGCMGMSWAYGPTNEAESIKLLHHALDIGINFWDTAEVYGPLRNEELLGKALKNKSRDKVIIATKFGFTWKDNNDNTEIRPDGLDSSPAHIRESIEGSLKRLGTDYIDLYYQHRLDPNTPIEETVQTLAELVKEGKVRHIGLSEVSPTTIRQAHAIHPITAVQSEYSLWDRGVEEKVLPTVRELGIGFVPFSPIGRGFLTGKIQNLNELAKNDFRQTLPRFQGDNFEHNMILVKLISKIGEAHKVTPVQIALAWLLRQGNDIVPIPGTKQIRYLDENAKAVDVQLPESAWREIDDLLQTFQIHGARYPESFQKMVGKRD